MEHPFFGSWGYQVTGYYTPCARWGSPDDFRYLVDYLHEHGIGVILDWVPGHFPTDEFALGRFDGTALYEHLDPRKGYHPEWNTYIFNFGTQRGTQLFWSPTPLLARTLPCGRPPRRCRRVDAISRLCAHEGEWIPNIYGGRENLEAISFYKEANSAAYEH